MKKRICFVLVGVGIGLATTTTIHAAEESPNKIGDGNDGSRSGPVHVISLFDDQGLEIKPTDERPRPISMRKTCGECHTYELISHGWHFNSSSTNVPSGRIGEPWVWSDLRSRTQIPISNREWEGTYSPDAVGMSSWKYLQLFASHMPGGNYGEKPPAEDDMEADPLEILRWPISGQFEINCLACHHADRRQDQSEAALQAARQNYRWIATAGSGLAVVKGTASALDDFYDPNTDYKIRTVYDKSRFDENDKVFLDIVRKAPPNRCYFCHSVESDEHADNDFWTADEDVHLAAGLTCVDCHRNSDDHMIVRGDVTESEDGNGAVSTLSCRGCHLGDETADPLSARRSGRLGAPYPKHAGIPTIHFEIMSCTACHSGPIPEPEIGNVRTARIHKMGMHGVHHLDLRLPHIKSPVFVKGEDGVIRPHRMMWPAFWGIMTEDEVVPMSPDVVKEMAPDELEVYEDDVEMINDWRPLTREQIASVLKIITGYEIEEPEEDGAPVSEAVYIAGGKLYRLDDDDQDAVVVEDHAAAKPYSWPLAHNVRPASQSLGVHGKCADCHSLDAPYFFGLVATDTPVVTEAGESTAREIEMVEWEEINPQYARAFAFSFIFRPWMKVIVLISSAVIGLVVLLFLLRALNCLVKASAKDEK